MTNFTEAPRYQLTEAEDMIAACLGHALKAAHTASKDSEARADAVWDVKQRMVNEMRLARATFNSDVFVERMQHFYEVATGF